MQEREKEHFKIIKQKEKNILDENIKTRPLLRIEQKREKPIDIFFRIEQSYLGHHQFYFENLENIMENIKKEIKKFKIEELKEMINDINSIYNKLDDK